MEQPGGGNPARQSGGHIPPESAVKIGRKIQVNPPELFYYLPRGNPSEGRKGRTWEGVPLGIVAVSNPSEVDIPKVKVRVNHLEFLVRPPRFQLQSRNNFVPLLVRLAPDHDEVKMQLVEEATSNDDAEQKLETRLTLRKVNDAASLRSGVKVTMARRGDSLFPVFHGGELTQDQVRYALENTGVKTVAADFISRGISFKKLCALVWGCCLRDKPMPGTFGFNHTPDCPIVKYRGQVILTPEGERHERCPCCGAERHHTREGPGGLSWMLINIVVQFIDPLA